MTFSIASMFGPAQTREMSDDEVFGTQATAKPAELSDEDVFGPQARPGLWDRVKANASEAFQNTLVGETRNRVISGQVSQFAANDMQRAIAEAEASGSGVGLDNFADGKPNPYATVPLDRLRGMFSSTSGEAARRSADYQGVIAERQAEQDAIPSFTTAPTIGGKILEGAAALFGQLAGGLPSPENFIGAGAGAARAAGERLAPALGRQFTAAAIPTAATAVPVDALQQSGQVARGEADAYDPLQTLESAVFGAALGGGLNAAPELARALRARFSEWRASRGSNGASPPTPDEVSAFQASPDLQAFMASNGIANPADPRVAQLDERLRARRAVEADAAQRPIDTDRQQLAQELEQIAAGELDPNAAAAFSARRAPVPPVIVPEATGTPGTAAGVDLRGKFNAPAIVEPQVRGMGAGDAARARADMEAPRAQPGGEPIFVGPDGTAGRRGETLPERTGLALPSPETASRVPMSDAEAARARAANTGGNANQAQGAERLVGQDGRAPQTPTDMEGQRQAGEAFRLAEAQRGRAGESVRDTQPAGRPEGTGAREVFLDDGFPVEILERRLVPDSRGNMVEVAKVRQYDPRTGAVVGDGLEYDVPVRQLKKSNYSPEPRRAQDFTDQAKGPPAPERPRMAGDPIVQREPAQTYRTTAEDPTVRGAKGPTSEAPGRGPSPRSPRPEQPEGPGPWRERPRTVDEAIRQYEEARRREEAARAAGEAPKSEGPRASDNKASNSAKPNNGEFAVDDRGFVMSDKGGPIKFADQKQATRWILNVGQKQSGAQVFEIANHPSGKGFTVRERGRTEAPGSAKGAKPAPDAKASATGAEPTGGPQKALPAPPRVEPEAPKAVVETPQAASKRPVGRIDRIEETVRGKVTTFKAFDRDGNQVGETRTANSAAEARRIRSRLQAQRERAARKAAAENPEPKKSKTVQAEPGKPARVDVMEERMGRTKVYRISTVDVNEKKVGEDFVTSNVMEMRAERDRRQAAVRRELARARGSVDAHVNDGRPLVHHLNEDVEADIFGGKITAEKVAERYGIPVEEAQALIDTAASRPDTTIKVTKSGYVRDPENGARINESAMWAEGEFGLKPEDYTSTAEFFDAVDRRMKERDALEIDARLDEDASVDADVRSVLNNEWAPAKETPNDIPFDPPAEKAAGAISENSGSGAGKAGNADRPVASGPDEAGRRANDGAGNGAAREEGGNAGAGSPRSERTAAGEQGVIPGAERSARQAQAKRDAEGGLSSKAPQKPADEGLFDKGSRGQGTLYSNGVFDPEAWRRAFGWAMPSVKDWTQSLDEFRKVMLRKNEGAAPAGQNILRSIFYAADSQVRAIGERAKTPEAREAIASFLDQWHARAGEARGAGMTYDEAVSSRTTSRINDLSKIIEKLSDDELAQVVRQVQTPATARAGTKIGDAAIGLSKFLREELKYLKDAGVDVGEVRGGYYPRIIDEQSVIKDRQGFLAAAESAYRKHLGMSGADAKVAAQEWLSRILYGNTDSHMPPPGGAAEANFIKGRVLPKAADETLRKFLVQDPKHALTSYVTHAVRRAEFTRRMGAEGEKWSALVDTLRKHGAEDTVNALQSYVSNVAGTKPSGLPASFLSAASWLRTWTAISLLEKATISSLAEIIMPATRAAAGSGNPFSVASNAGRALGQTVLDLVGKTKGAAERRALAEDLGLIHAHMDPIMSAARWAGGDVTSMKQNYVLQKFFQRTGLEAWTNATRVAAVGVGQTFLRRLALDADKNPNITRNLLAELGVPKERAAEFASWLAKTNEGKPAPEALDGEFGQMYRTAMTRFVDQSILRPSAATKPGWATHPLGAVAFQIMAYTSAFHKNVIQRPIHMAKQSDLTAVERAKMIFPTVLGMSLLVPAQAIIGEARDTVLGDPNKKAEETGAQKWLKALSRSGLTGGADPMLNALTGVKYGRDFATSVAGPGLGRIGQAVDATVSAVTRNSPNTNSAERKIAQVFYDMGVEPAVNLLLAAAPGGSIAAAAATQAVGSGTVREKFVSAVAGEKENKPGARTRDGRSAGNGTRGRDGR